VFSYLTYGANPKSTTPPSASVTVTYLTHTVQTNFGCGVGEYNQSAALVDKITLADGSFYQFTYEPTPGNSSNVTGRLASISLPTGGTISYTYTGGSHGINCADGSTTGITRTTSDGTRTYVRSAITTTSSHTDIADDSSPANHSAFDFVTPGSSAAFYETNRANYQGSTSGAQLLSRQTCYNASTAPCNTTAVTLPISQIDTYETLFNGGLEHGATAKYNTYGLQTEQDTYDFGTASARGGLLRKELWVYPSTGIVSLLSSDTVQDGSANKISQTTYAYDETTGSGHAALAKTSGLPQHGGAVGTQRGNLTTVTQWNNLGTSIVTASAYEDTGNPVSTLTPNGTTGFSYDPATHVFLNTTTPPTPSSGVALSSSATYDANTGVLLTTTDANSQTTTYKSYDELLRPTEIDFPDGGKTYPVYTSPNVQYVQTLQNSSNTYGYTYADFDALGRTDRAAVYNGQGGSPWYQQDGCFDANGHLGFQSYAYQNTGFNYPDME
jgi:YD repeat-containing protein